MSFRGVLRLFVLLLLSAASAAAQSVVSGTVTDAQGNNIAGAKVALSQGGTERMSTTTDSSGRFEHLSDV